MVVPLIPVVTGIGGFLVRKKVWVAATGLVVTTFYIGHEAYQTVFGEEAADKLTDEFKEAGAEIIEEIGDAALMFVEGFGGAVINGLDNTYDYIRDRMRGKEADVIAGIVVAALSVGTVLFLYYNMKSRELGPALKVK